MNLDVWLRNRPDDDALFANISSSSDISMALVASRPSAQWNFRALSTNVQISLRDKLDHPTLPWTIMNRPTDETPPISVVLSLPSLPWSYTQLMHQWPLQSILQLDPVPEWMDWEELSVRGAADVPIVLANVSLPCAALLPFERSQPACPWKWRTLSLHAPLKTVGNHPDVRFACSSQQV
jgi:hypothetical protein